MTLLILCNLIFLLVPLVAYLARTHRAVFYVFFGISLVAISWIVFFRILPDTFDHFGLRGILMAVLGFALVGLGETRFRRIPLHPGTLTRLVLITFILVHTVLDGAAIFGSVHLGEETGGHHHQALGYGILVHRLFLGALLWQVLLPGYGRLLTSGIFILMVVGTLLEEAHLGGTASPIELPDTVVQGSPFVLTVRTTQVSITSSSVMKFSLCAMSWTTRFAISVRRALSRSVRCSRRRSTSSTVVVSNGHSRATE